MVIVPQPAPPAPPPRAAVPPKPIPAGRWELLAERQADLNLDRDRIPVGRGPYRELQLVVRGAPLEIHEMVVTFGNGEQFRPKLRFHFDEQTTSRVIDLPGDLRNIKQVDFLYRTPTKRQGKAVITLYGR